MRANDDTLRRLYLMQELDVSVETIEAGLAELWDSRPYQARHFVFLLLLATGMERLLKLVLHLRALETTGAFLSRTDMRRNYGHNLVELCDAVVSECFTPNYTTLQAARRDREFLDANPTFRETLTLLSDFAMADRYVYMNGISDPAREGEWPERRWEDLEVGTMPAGEYSALFLAGREREAKAHANRALAACLETFVRAVARLFVSEVLGSQARQVSPAVSRYIMLDDDELGKKGYTR